MPSDQFKAVASRALEVVGAVLLALLCFGGFLFILKLLFPSGTPFSELLKGAGQRQASHARAPRQGGPDYEPFVASLSSYRNSVKAKSSGDIAWSDVVEKMPLYDRDAVQTAKESSAVISFDADNSLEMASSSLVIIKSLARDRASNERKSVLLVLDGELRGNLSGSGKDTLQLEMALPGGFARVHSRKGADGRALFTVRVNPDKSSTLTVLHGFAEVTARDKTVRVGANLSTTVGLTGAPGTPVRLLAAPEPEGPAAGDIFVYRKVPPEVRFSWRRPAGATETRLLLARDAGFKKTVLDEKLAQAAYRHGNLQQGEYFWKVSSFHGWAEGKSSAVRRFRVVQDLEPPPLQVEFPPPVSEEGQFLLRGATEAGAELFVNNKPVATGARGAFALQLQLERGVNVITVEAVDAAGNIAYRTHKVVGKF